MRGMVTGGNNGTATSAELISAIGSPAASGDTQSELATIIETAKGDLATSIEAKITAQASADFGDAALVDVLSGKTFSSETVGYLKTGTMIDRGTVSTDITTVAQEVTIATGKHSGSGVVKISATEQAKVIAGNIKSGITLLGQAGSLVPMQTATGTFTPTSTLGYFVKSDGGTYGTYFIEITSLTFTPKVIIVAPTSEESMPSGVFYGELDFGQHSGYTSARAVVFRGTAVDAVISIQTPAVVNSTGFKLPVNGNYYNVSLTWIAIG